MASVSKKEACIEEFNRLLKAGPPGMGELKRIAPTLYRFYEVDTIDEQTKVLETCGLKPIPSTYPVTFEPPFRCQFEEQPLSEDATKCRAKKKSKKSAVLLLAVETKTTPALEEPLGHGEASPAFDESSINGSQNPPQDHDPSLPLGPPSPASVASVLPLPLPLQEETVRA
jgi:hypothetical protein